MKKMKKNISLKCSICGNDQFTTVDKSVEDIESASDDTEIKCSDCGQIVTKEQLFKENEYVIDANMEDFKKDVMEEVTKDFKKMFRKFK